jgi:hypothetical protein
VPRRSRHKRRRAAAVGVPAPVPAARVTDPSDAAGPAEVTGTGATGTGAIGTGAIGIARVFRWLLEEVSDDLGNIGDDIPQLADGFRWTDLHGEGIPGLPAEQGGSWYYRPNRGGGQLCTPARSTRCRPAPRCPAAGS